MDEQKPVDIEILKSFSPLDGLKRENLHALARKTRLQELAQKEGFKPEYTLVAEEGADVVLALGSYSTAMLAPLGTKRAARGGRLFSSTDRISPAPAAMIMRPMARPSRPSVRLTALEVATTTKTMKGR